MERELLPKAAGSQQQQPTPVGRHRKGEEGAREWICECVCFEGGGVDGWDVLLKPLCVHPALLKRSRLLLASQRAFGWTRSRGSRCTAFLSHYSRHLFTSSTIPGFGWPSLLPLMSCVFILVIICWLLAAAAQLNDGDVPEKRKREGKSDFTHSEAFPSVWVCVSLFIINQNRQRVYVLQDREKHFKYVSLMLPSEPAAVSRCSMWIFYFFIMLLVLLITFCPRSKFSHRSSSFFSLPHLGLGDLVREECSDQNVMTLKKKSPPGGVRALGPGRDLLTYGLTDKYRWK